MDQIPAICEHRQAMAEKMPPELLAELQALGPDCHPQPDKEDSWVKPSVGDAAEEVGPGHRAGAVHRPSHQRGARGHHHRRRHTP